MLITVNILKDSLEAGGGWENAPNASPSYGFVVYSSIKPPLSMIGLFMVTRSTSPNMVKSDLIWAHHRPYSHLCGECSGKDRSPDILMVKTKKSSF